MTSRTSLTRYAAAMQDPQPGVKAAELQAMQAGAWDRRWFCASIDDPRLDDWDKARLNAIGVKLFGQRRA